MDESMIKSFDNFLTKYLPSRRNFHQKSSRIKKPKNLKICSVLAGVFHSSILNLMMMKKATSSEEKRTRTSCVRFSFDSTSRDSPKRINPGQFYFKLLLASSMCCMYVHTGIQFTELFCVKDDLILWKKTLEFCFC